MVLGPGLPKTKKIVLKQNNKKPPGSPGAFLLRIINTNNLYSLEKNNICGIMLTTIYSYNKYYIKRKILKRGTNIPKWIKQSPARIVEPPGI